MKTPRGRPNLSYLSLARPLRGVVLSGLLLLLPHSGEATEPGGAIAGPSSATARRTATSATAPAATFIEQTEDSLAATRRTGVAAVEADAKKTADRIKRGVADREQALKNELLGRSQAAPQEEAAFLHENIRVAREFPSASQCAVCHPDQYRQWSVSSHAYAQLSPIYNSLSEKLNRLTNGTNGDFCVRCHTSVGMATDEPIFEHTADRTPIAREGVTCVVCHRTSHAQGRVSGRTVIERGNLTGPVYGPSGDEVLKAVLDRFDLTTDSKLAQDNWRVADGDQIIHGDAVQVEAFRSAALCSHCHDVNGQNGFRLEEAYSQYRNSPSAAQGATCQDCHMGKILGRVSGYDEGPIASIGGAPTPSGRRTNHMFAGPDYSVVHPGLFPHNPASESIASFEEWLTFDVEAGWGTAAFEESLPSGHEFPHRWRTVRSRIGARVFIEKQLRLLGEYRAQCFRTLRHGYQLGKFVVTRDDASGIEFSLEVKNASGGHSAPTGFDGERLVFLEVTVRDRDGTIVFQSGDRDPNGDLRDLHSEYTKKGLLPLDPFLFSLESQFLGRTLRGGEREQVLPVPVSQTALVFLRPNAQSSLLAAHPPFIRKHNQSIAPLGKKTARYRIAGAQLSGKGPYSLRVRLIAQMVPVNLITAIASVGFDYNLSPKDVAERTIEGGFPLYTRHVVFRGEQMEADWTPTEDEVLGPDAVVPGLPWLAAQDASAPKGTDAPNDE